ncbi:peptidylprolyl isomerase SurA [uncultured Psychromonas sp.]|uniref:peptidylprolyl isomerase SurA n=1 Tax=uncultured Psychromonas sp. TaxID=173974 RepID=UPI002631903D|nr:peptidylprolyl isomerase SurA [uncultured Psychromonas sp.]
MKLTKRFLSVLVLASTLPQLATAAEVQLDKIEAVVNKELILSSDMSNLKRDLITRYKDSGQTLPDPKNIDKQILDKLISDKLQLQIAERIGLRISDAQLDQTITEMAKKQNKTLNELRADIEASGTNYKAFVANIRDELTINEVRQVQVRRRINISDQEIQQVVDRIKEQGEQTTEFHFAHILLKLSPEASEEKRIAVTDEANSLVEKIENGADIKQLAIANSEGPKALEGGDWGWRKLDSIPSLFVENLQESNKKGDIIGPFNTRMGVHIIQVLDKKGNDNVITEEVNARHILVKPTIILSDEKAKLLLTTLRQQILSGTKTFDELAKEYSQDPGSAVKGGELGWADPNMYVPEFRDLAQSQTIGEISQPFHTMHGWHILQVLDKRESDTTENATKQKAYSMLFRQRFPAEAYAWLNEIRQEAYIKINNPAYIIEEE